MTALLDILHEIEPDGGWKAVPRVEYVRSPRAVLLPEPDRGLSESEALRAYAAGQVMGVRR